MGKQKIDPYAYGNAKYKAKKEMTDSLSHFNNLMDEIRNKIVPARNNVLTQEGKFKNEYEREESYLRDFNPADFGAYPTAASGFINQSSDIYDAQNMLESNAMSKFKDIKDSRGQMEQGMQDSTNLANRIKEVLAKYKMDSTQAEMMNPKRQLAPGGR